MTLNFFLLKFDYWYTKLIIFYADFENSEKNAKKLFIKKILTFEVQKTRNFLTSYTAWQKFLEKLLVLMQLFPNISTDFFYSACNFAFLNLTPKMKMNFFG